MPKKKVLPKKTDVVKKKLVETKVALTGLRRKVATLATNALVFSDLLGMENAFPSFHENNKGTELSRIITKANKSKHFVSVVSHNRPGRCEQTGLMR